MPFLRQASAPACARSCMRHATSFRWSASSAWCWARFIPALPPHSGGQPHQRAFSPGQQQRAGDAESRRLGRSGNAGINRAQHHAVSEILLEFELEKMLKQKRSLIQQRASQHLNMNVKQSISSINDMDCDYKEYRKRRMSEIDNITERPQVKFPRSKCKRNEQEV